MRVLALVLLVVMCCGQVRGQCVTPVGSDGVYNQLSVEYDCEALQSTVTLSTTWTSGGDTVHTVTTKKGSSESNSEFKDRHDAAVAAAQLVFPPD